MASDGNRTNTVTLERDTKGLNSLEGAQIKYMSIFVTDELKAVL
jgi:hypothetical protein